MDELFAIERDIWGKSATERFAVRMERSAPLVATLEAWMREHYALMSKHADVAKAINYMLSRWDGFARFLTDGRICLSNNAAERALRGIALGRKAWLFCGSDRDGERAAIMYSLIATAKMNDIDPQAWLADGLARGRAILALRYAPHELIWKVLSPWSFLRGSLMIPSGVDFNDRRSLEVELPAGNGVGTARAIARACSAFAEGGAEIGMKPETLGRITAAPTLAGVKDEVLGIPAQYSLGFLRPGPGSGFGSSPRAFGHPGAGGSFAFADPDARLGYAYVMNKLDFYLFGDPREKALRDAVYRALGTAARARAA